MKTLIIQPRNFTFTTFNTISDEVDTYVVQAYNIKEARQIAQKTVANSRWNEVRHSRVVLKK